MLRSLLRKKDTPFNHEQLFTIAIAQRSGGNIFHQLPAEITERICTVANPNPRLKKALHHTVYGNLAAVKAMLEEAKREGLESLKLLLLPLETTVTPGGLKVKNTTLLKCAVLGGDPEMFAMIKPYFYEFEGGAEELERQLASCQPCVDAMTTQAPEDLNWLFKIIIEEASAQDVAEELKVRDLFDKTYQSPLRDALNKWRQAKLDPANRVIDVLRAPRMFCNYNNWIHVNAFLDNEWKSNSWRDLRNGYNCDKISLILRQIRGLLELLELPVCERFAFANDQVKNPSAQLIRSLHCKDGDGGFPNFDSSSFDLRTGLGFDFYVSIHGSAGVGTGGSGPAGAETTPLFRKLMLNKNLRLTELMRRPQQSQLQPRAGV